MRTTLGRFAAAVACILCALASAASAADAPATAEEAAVRAAAVAGTKALFGEDLEAARKTIVAAKPEQGWTIIEYRIREQKARRGLVGEIVKRFGAPGKAYSVGLENTSFERLDAELDDVREGKVFVRGGEATIEETIEHRVVADLRKDGGVWKLLRADAPTSARDVELHWKWCDDKLAALGKMAGDVRNGAYKTLDDVDRDVYEFEIARGQGVRVSPRGRIDPGSGGRIVPDVPEIRDGPQPRAEVKAPSRRVVFVLDGSETSRPYFDLMKPHLRAALQAMRPPQSFSIVAPADDKVHELAKNFLFVTPENKRKAVEFLDGTKLGGKSDLAAAMKAAMELQPELIYLTTVGIPKDAKLREAVRALTKGARVKVNIVAVEAKGDYEGELRGIAEDTGGVYKVVSAQDLKNF